MWIDKPGEKENLHDLFPLPCEQFRTNGVGDGVILKFKTFYLKIYDYDTDVCSYVVQGYLYHNQNPTIVDIVPYNKMREYASKFRSDDFLVRHRKERDSNVDCYLARHCEKLKTEYC